MLEIDVDISKLFYKLKDTLPNTVVLKTSATWKIQAINNDSSIGEQIKYYRRLAKIKQADLSKKLGYDKGALQSIENKEIKLANLDLLKATIIELNIEDKININDDYIAFLLNNSRKSIYDFRKSLKLTRLSLANKIGVSFSAIKDWETGRTTISRTSYEKLKKCMS